MAQSGEVQRRGKESWIETVVTGPGTLDFSWALTEATNRESRLTVFVDGVRQPGGEIWGETGWVPRQIEVPEGRHTVRWRHKLDYTEAEASNTEASYGWLTDLAWAPDSAQSDTTVTTPVAVPHGWLNGYPGLFSTEADYERVALDDQDGDGHPTWCEFIAGTDPVNPMSAFTALIEQGPAGLIIGWTPDLTPARDYQVEGKADLRDADWGPTNAATRFFRVNVTLP